VRRRAFIASVAAGVSLTGCGFSPVYMRTASGTAGIAQSELSSVHVDIIPDRPGQLLRQALQQRLEGSGSGLVTKYDLSVNYSIGGEGIAIQPDNTVTRIRFIARGAWTLYAQNPAHTQLAKGSAMNVDGLNILDQQYFEADLVTEVVQRRMSEQIADQITIQLAAYFRKQAAAAAKA